MKCPKCGAKINPAKVMGAKGGKAKSKAKTLACRKNGAKGAQKTKELWVKIRKSAILGQKPEKPMLIKSYDMKMKGIDTPMQEITK